MEPPKNPGAQGVCAELERGQRWAERRAVRTRRRAAAAIGRAPPSRPTREPRPDLYRRRNNRSPRRQFLGAVRTHLHDRCFGKRRGSPYRGERPRSRSRRDPFRRRRDRSIVRRDEAAVAVTAFKGRLAGPEQERGRRQLAVASRRFSTTAYRSSSGVSSSWIGSMS
jgi:hypothetical protein